MNKENVEWFTENDIEPEEKKMHEFLLQMDCRKLWRRAKERMVNWLMRDIRLEVASLRVNRPHTVYTDTIAEKTADAGVTIDGCLVKDGKAADADTVDGLHWNDILGLTPKRDINGVVEYENTPSLLNDLSSSGSSDQQNVWVEVYNNTFNKQTKHKFIKIASEVYHEWTSCTSYIRWKVTDGIVTLYTNQVNMTYSGWTEVSSVLDIRTLANGTITVAPELYDCSAGGLFAHARYLKIFRNLTEAD